ncbi:hypothetical protein ACF0H5_023911 [Mactra antiquata]
MAGNSADENYRNIGICLISLKDRDIDGSLHAAKGIVDPNVLFVDETGECIHVLYQAVRANHPSVVQLLLQKGANVNFQDEEGETPLFAALDIDIDESIQRLLYSYGADVGIKNKAGNTAVMNMAIRGLDFRHKFTDITLFNLLTRCTSFKQLNSREQSLIHMTPFVHNVEILENCDEHICVKFLKLLIDNGVYVNTRDSTGLTPLHYACFACCQKAVEYLVDQGADMTAKSTSGQTVLHALGSSPSGTNFQVIFEYLVGMGLDATDSDMFGRNILHYAASSNKVTKKAVETILDHCDLAKTKDNFGLTALHLCVIPPVFMPRDHLEDDEEMKNDVSEVISLLCHHGAIVNAVDNNQLTPLHYVVRYEAKKPTIEALLSHGANVLKRTKTGESVIHRATMFPGVLQCIIDHVAEKVEYLDIDMTDDFGCTALHWAVYFKSPECVSILLEVDADPNIVNSNGLTSHEYAISSKATNLFEVLGISNAQQTYPLPYKITEEDLLSDNSYCERMFGKTKEMMAEEREALNSIINQIHTNNSNESGVDEAMEGSCIIHEEFGLELTKKVIGEGEKKNLQIKSPVCNTPKCNEDRGNINIVMDESIVTSSEVTTSESKTNKDTNDWQSDSECTEEEQIECSKIDHMWFGCPLLSKVSCTGDVVYINEWTSHIPCHSRSLAAYMGHVLDSKQMGLQADADENTAIANNVKRLMNLVALEIKQTNPLFEFKLKLAGSWNEGTKITYPDEFDYKLILLKFNNAVEPHESEDPELKGFVRFKIKAGDHNEAFRNFLADDGFLDGRKVVRALYTAINSVLLSIPPEALGQLYSTKYLKIEKSSIDHLSFRWVGALYKNLLIDIDIVPTIVPQSWNSSFLFTSKRQLNVTGSSSVVLKTPNSWYVKKWYTYFRLSVADQEADIFGSLPNEILEGYILVKSLLESLSFPQIRMDDEGGYLRTRCLTTYMLKSSFLHQVEKRGVFDNSYSDSSNPSCLRQVSIEMAKHIVDYLEDSMRRLNYLESFFIPGVNLLANDSLTRFNNKKFFLSEIVCLSLMLEVGTEELQKQASYPAVFGTKIQKMP